MPTADTRVAELLLAFKEQPWAAARLLEVWAASLTQEVEGHERAAREHTTAAERLRAQARVLNSEAEALRNRPVATRGSAAAVSRLALGRLPEWEDLAVLGSLELGATVDFAARRILALDGRTRRLTLTTARIIHALLRADGQAKTAQQLRAVSNAASEHAVGQAIYSLRKVGVAISPQHPWSLLVGPADAALTDD